MNEGFKINCPRCGAEMNSNARYCMKCGYINTNNAANQNMMPYVQQEQAVTYQIGSGQVINQNTDTTSSGIANNTGNKTICFLINFTLFMLIMIVSFFISVNGKELSVYTIKSSFFPYIAFLGSLIFIHLYSWQLIYMKCNQRWWSFLIPIYSSMVLTDILYKKKWLGLLVFVPVVGQIFSLVMLYTLGKRFKYNGLLTVLFSLIMVPFIGFGTHFYNNTEYVDENHSLEKSYKKNKMFLGFSILFFIVGSVFIFWNNIVDVKDNAQKLSNYYYLYVTNRMIDKTKQLIDENYLECDNYKYSANSGVYYVQYPDVGQRVFIPFYHLKDDSISAYVIIDNTSGTSKYYISMSDGTYGYPETLYENFTKDNIVKYKEIKFKDASEVNYCEIKKATVSVGSYK